MIKVQIIKNTLNDLPKYETIESAGCDLRADLYNIDNKYLYKSECIYNLGSIVPELHIKPGGRALIPTGLKMALPVGYEAQIRPRSGLALKSGITVLNTPGTIDSDYRGDVGVILINNGFEEFVVKQGDRIAQMVISKIEQIEFDIVKELNETRRGNSGFGHTGIN